MDRTNDPTLLAFQGERLYERFHHKYKITNLTRVIKLIGVRDRLLTRMLNLGFLFFVFFEVFTIEDSYEIEYFWFYKVLDNKLKNLNGFEFS